MTALVRNTRMRATAALTALSLRTIVLASTSPTTDAAVQRSDVMVVSTPTV